MKIVLVDDEQAVLTGLRFVIEEFRPDYKIAGSFLRPLQALEFLRQNPVDLVITDVKMPELSGVELVGLITGECPKTQVVVFSAHSDFEFVRSCMKNGAADYMLKPLHFETILGILDKVNQKLFEQQGIAEKAQATEAVRFALINGITPLPASLAGTSVNLLFVQCPNRETSDIGPLLDLGDYCLTIDGIQILLVRTEEKYRYCLHRLESLALPEVLYEAFSSVPARPEELREKFEQAKTMLGFLQFNQIGPTVTASQFEAHLAAFEKLDFSRYFGTEDIKILVVNFSEKEVKNTLQSKWKQLDQDFPLKNPARLKECVLYLLVTLEKRIKQYPPFSETNSDQKTRALYDRIEKRSSFQDLAAWMCDLLAQIARSHPQDVPPYIYEAMKQINQTFMNKISLDEIADSVFLNKWYFSLQFKKYAGISFTEYLNQVRITHAKGLLRQKDLKIYQVAEQTGFQDTSYFNMVFKKSEGLSPREYQAKIEQE